MRATVPVRVQDGFPFVTAEVNGRLAAFLLDTGSHSLLLLPDAAARLGLTTDPGQSTRLLGTGGARDVPNVVLRGMTLGGAPVAGGSVPVSALQHLPVTDPPLAGLLGANLLASYDLELDFGAGRLTLLAPTGCPTLAGAAMPLRPIPGGDYAVDVLVNGAPVLALPDTGSRQTLLSTEAARRLGLDAPIAASTTHGVDGQRVPMRFVQLRSVQVATDRARSMPASVTELRLEPVEMLLGLDWFRQRRVWLSHAGAAMVI